MRRDHSAVVAAASTKAVNPTVVPTFFVRIFKGALRIGRACWVRSLGHEQTTCTQARRCCRCRRCMGPCTPSTRLPWEERTAYPRRIGTRTRCRPHGRRRTWRRAPQMGRSGRPHTGSPGCSGTRRRPSRRRERSRTTSAPEEDSKSRLPGRAFLSFLSPAGFRALLLFCGELRRARDGLNFLSCSRRAISIIPFGASSSNSSSEASALHPGPGGETGDR